MKDNIVIGHHSLESSGAGAAYLDRHKSIITGRYDGVHMYGVSGCKDYTNSVKSILMLALPGCGTAQTESHENCPQAAFQKKTKYQSNVQTQNRFSVFNSNMGN